MLPPSRKTNEPLLRLKIITTLSSSFYPVGPFGLNFSAEEALKPGIVTTAFVAIILNCARHARFEIPFDAVFFTAEAHAAFNYEPQNDVSTPRVEAFFVHDE